MTPQEKAQELVNRFAPYVDTFHKGILENAKQCALIAVDEVLNDDWFIPNREDSLARKKYWEEVKQEINKL